MALVIRDTGEVVDWEDVNSLARALDWIREAEREFRSAKAAVQRAIADQAEIRGTKTLTLEDGRKAVVGGGSRTVWDGKALHIGLLALGMPIDRVEEIIQLEYKVKAVEAERAAKASDRYRVMVEACKTVDDAPVSVSLKTS